LLTPDVGTSVEILRFAQDDLKKLHKKGEYKKRAGEFGIWNLTRRIGYDASGAPFRGEAIVRLLDCGQDSVAVYQVGAVW